MSFNINIKVNKNGTLKSEIDPLELSVYKESKRVKLAFSIDSEIDSTYHYLKFSHAKTTYLYRVHDNAFEVPKAITAWEGRWEMSFVCCDEPANSDNTITANYIYASKPIIADIAKGNLGYTAETEEQVMLKKICEGTFDYFSVPSSVDTLCANLFSNMNNTFEFYITANVKTIKEHVLYQSGCTKITFEEGSQLTTLEDNAFYRILNLGDIKFPKTLSSWGKYNLSYCGCSRIEFEANSNLRTLTSYAFWNITGLVTLCLPDRLDTFSGGTAVIKSCPSLEEIRFPNTLTTSIAKTAIQDCPNVKTIWLQSNFNVSANFSNCDQLTEVSMVAMFNALKDLAGSTPKTLTLGATNLARVTAEEKAIATSKNWVLE